MDNNSPTIENVMQEKLAYINKKKLIQDINAKLPKEQEIKYRTFMYQLNNSSLDAKTLLLLADQLGIDLNQLKNDYLGRDKK